MGLLSFIFGKPPVVVDDFFGEMKFIEWKKDPSKNYFECNRHFAPSGKNIELSVDADMPGPTQTQKDFFGAVEKRYDELIAGMTPLIEQNFQGWDMAFVIRDFRSELDPVYMGLPRCDKEPIAWHIGLVLITNRNFHITIKFEGFEVKSIEVDT